MYFMDDPNKKCPLFPNVWCFRQIGVIEKSFIDVHLWENALNQEIQLIGLLASDANRQFLYFNF